MNAKRLRFVAKNGRRRQCVGGGSTGRILTPVCLGDGVSPAKGCCVRGQSELEQQETAGKLEVDRETVLAGLMEAVDVARAQGDPGAMNRAWAEIGKLLGYYKMDRVKVDLHVNVATKRLITDLETRSDAELLAIVAGDAES